MKTERELITQMLGALLQANSLLALRGTDYDDIDEAITAAREYLDAPEQLPVVGTKTWFDDGKLITQNLTAADIYKEQEAKPLPGADWTITMRRMMNSGCSKRKCTCKPENAENCIWWDEPGDAPDTDTLAEQYTKLAQHCVMLESKLAAVEKAETWQIWCDTCEGSGTVDNTLGGDNINATSHDKCPDCDGRGFNNRAAPEQSEPMTQMEIDKLICERDDLRFALRKLREQIQGDCI